MRPLPNLTAHVAALKAVLSGGGFVVYVGDVTGTVSYPSVMIQAATGLPVSVNLASDQEEVSEGVNVTVVDDSPANCMVTIEAVRALLHGLVIEVDGRSCEPLRLTGAQPVVVDRDVTITGTNRHPAYGVDTWRLVSTPG